MNAQETQKIWSLYKITNQINGKIYIGQAADVSKRWSDHRRAVKLNKPTQVVHYAMIKHGLDNFEFEVIACCKTQDDANDTETELVKQYNSFIKNGNGYNATLGGMNAPKSDEWKQSMKEWRESLSPEEKESIKEKQREATIKQIEEKGHPAQGRVVTEEEKELHRKSRLENPIEYTPELRQKMSEAHLDKTFPEEQRKKMSNSIKEQWEIRGDYESKKCNAPGCTVTGKNKYIILNDIRYCTVHGQRMRRNGTLEKLPVFKYTVDNPMPEEVRKKCGVVNIGKVAHNRIQFTPEQINNILLDTRSIKKISKDFKVTEKVIARIKLGKY